MENSERHAYTNPAYIKRELPHPPPQYAAKGKPTWGESCGIWVRAKGSSSSLGTRVFDIRRVFESYCQDDVSVLREAWRVLMQEFIQIGNIDVFLESVTIASACNKVMRKRLLKPKTIGLIPWGGYTGNVNYSNKAIMWLVYREQTDGFTIRHARNGREYRPPDQCGWFLRWNEICLRGL